MNQSIVSVIESPSADILSALHQICSRGYIARAVNLQICCGTPSLLIALLSYQQHHSENVHNLAAKKDEFHSEINHQIREAPNALTSSSPTKLLEKMLGKRIAAIFDIISYQGFVAPQSFSRLSQLTATDSNLIHSALRRYEADWQTQQSEKDGFDSVWKLTYIQFFEIIHSELARQAKQCPA